MQLHVSTRMNVEIDDCISHKYTADTLDFKDTTLIFDMIHSNLPLLNNRQTQEIGNIVKHMKWLLRQLGSNMQSETS